jgi:hypothetical protein
VAPKKLKRSYNSGFEEHEKKERLPITSSGDSTLDQLLNGGFRKDLLYLLIGDRKITSNVLLETAVQFFKGQAIAPSSGGESSRYGIFKRKVAIVDGNNRFNPYAFSKLAVSLDLSPTKVLESVLISRAFTYEQMVELLENKIAELEQVGAVFISGITSLWPNYDQRTFEDLLRAIGGIKKVLEKLDPLIVITAPKNEYSDFKPVGGNAIYHFGQVLVLIEDKKRYAEYKLIQHPSLPENRLIKWKPLKPKRGLKKPAKNATLDSWF